jgi:hypothetical protein
MHGGGRREVADGEVRREGGSERRGTGVDRKHIVEEKRVMELLHMTLGDMTESSERKARQGEALVKKSNSAMGGCDVVCCFEGGLAPGLAAGVAIKKWWAKVSAGAPMAWAYVGVDKCGISATNAGKLEMAQAKLARSILAAPRRVPIAVLFGELGWTSVQLKMMRKVLVEWGTS